jgi:hypothetical protein
VRRAARSLTAGATALAACAAAAAPALGASLRLQPATVRAAQQVRVSGDVGGGCAPGSRVTLISGAFAHTHDFAGRPAVFTPVRPDGSFRRRIRIPAGRTPGRYAVTARCGGGNLGVSLRLRVLAARITATRIAIGDHPAFVRVVVRFRGGLLGANDAEATDPNPSNGVARMVVAHAGIRTTAPALTRLGVQARVSQGAGRLRVRLQAVPRRFKYLAYRQLHGPERLAMDLYKSRPPGPAAEIPSAPGGCLTIASHAGTPGSVTAMGTAQGIFENQFTLAVRNAAGRLAGQTHVAFGTTAPNWQATVGYNVTMPQMGTLEAVDFSARDGALACLAQVRVPLAP